MFVGEAPGYHEDRQGAPFVGQAGKVLERCSASIGLSRPEVYIANVLKCRPPGNRDPQPDEIAACEGHLFSQVELIRPRVICTLGQLRHQAPVRPAARDHPRARPRPAAPDRRRRPGALPDLPPGRGPLHPGDDGDAAGTTSRSSRSCSRPSPWPQPCRRTQSRRPSPRPSRSPSQSPNTRSWASSSSERDRTAGGGGGGACCGRATSSTSPASSGAGKTVFVRGACRALGVEGPVTSPTYTVGNLYSTPAGRVAHLDLYRSAGVTVEEAADLEPYFDGHDLLRRVAGGRRGRAARSRAWP